MRNDKRGATWQIILGVIVVLVIGFVIFAFTGDTNTETAEEKGKIDTILEETFTSQGGETISLESIKNENIKKITTFIFKYIFGMHKGILSDLQVSTGEPEDLSIRGAIIIIATWIIFFIIFTDMAILTMGFSSKLNGFLIGLAVTVIFANFGILYWLIVLFMGIFSFLAGLSVIAALFAIIVLGVGAHFGAGWALTALKNKQKIRNIETGFKKVAATAKGLKETGEAVE